MTTRFVIRTFLLSSCVFSEAGVSKVLTKITRLPLTVAKNKTSSQKYFFCKIPETIEYSGKGFISMDVVTVLSGFLGPEQTFIML